MESGRFKKGFFYMYSKYYFVLVRVKNKVHRFHHWGVCAQI